MKLKINLNLWDITCMLGKLKIKTIFNSGYIDDSKIILKYFKKTNKNATNIVINKISK